MLRAAFAGAATLLLLLVAALTTTTGSAPIRGQVASASPQVDAAVPKVPEPLPSVTVTAAPPKPAPIPARVAAVVPQPASPAVRSVTNSPLTVNGSGTGNSGVAGVRSLVSTAYCEQGRMANGEYTYWGAVAMAEPFGSRWLVLSGPLAGQVFTVADHYGHGTQFDVAMPGDRGRARVYGLRIIQVVRVG